MSIRILASHNYKNNIIKVKQLLRRMWWRAAKYCVCIWNGLQNTCIQWNSRWGQDSTACVYVCMCPGTPALHVCCVLHHPPIPTGCVFQNATWCSSARQLSRETERVSRCDSRIHTWAHDIIRCSWCKQNHKLKMMIFLQLRGTEGGLTCWCVLASETVFYFYHRKVHYF